MRKIRNTLVGLTVFLSVAISGNALTIDFNSYTPGTIAGGSLAVAIGSTTVTFVGPGLKIRDVSLGGVTNRVLSTSIDAGPITATFGAGYTAGYVEITNWLDGSLTTEVDIIDGTAFNSTPVQIDFLSSSNLIHRLNGPGIASVSYKEYSAGQGFVLDNFTFEGRSSVPDGGSSLLLLGGALGLLGLVRRRLAA